MALAEGRKIIKNSTAPKTLVDGRIKIEEGQVSYETLVATPPKENLLTVPRGGQFMVVLSDGTKVWLNAESSLRNAT